MPPFNGSGTFITYTPGNPVVTGTTIDSTAHNATIADISNGLTNAITRDGQSPASANIPMGGFKLTGLAAGSAASDSARFDQITTTAAILAASGGAALIGNTPAGNIAATTVQTALNELDTEKAKVGLATASGLTMSTARVLGRTTAATGAIEELTAAQVATFSDAVTTAGSQTVTGAKTFSTAPILGSAPFSIPSGSAPVYGARAWVLFDTGRNSGGGTDTALTNRLLLGSGNVTSVLRNAIGDFTITFTTAMPDANYSLSGSAKASNANDGMVVWIKDATTPTTTVVNIMAGQTGRSGVNVSVGLESSLVSVVIFR